jgi:hypothetical protein
MSNRDKIISHAKTIREKHDALDKKIEEAYNHYTDDETITKMKIEKLHLKEELVNIEREIGKEDAKRIPNRF